MQRCHIMLISYWQKMRSKLVLIEWKFNASYSRVIFGIACPQDSQNTEMTCSQFFTLLLQMFFLTSSMFSVLALSHRQVTVPWARDVTIALQAFSCLLAVSPCLTPALMSLDSKFNILTRLSYCILAIRGPGYFIDYVFKYHIVSITNIFTNRVV